MTITTQRMVLFVGSCYNENVEGTGSRIGYYKRVDSVTDGTHKRN